MLPAGQLVPPHGELPCGDLTYSTADECLGRYTITAGSWMGNLLIPVDHRLRVGVATRDSDQIACDAHRNNDNRDRHPLNLTAQQGFPMNPCQRRIAAKGHAIESMHDCIPVLSSCRGVNHNAGCIPRASRATATATATVTVWYCLGIPTQYRQCTTVQVNK